MLSEDQDIAVAGSEAQNRMRQYAGLFDELTVAAPVAGPPCAEERIGPLSLYPVCGRFLFSARVKFWSALKRLCRENRYDVVSAQGPNELGLMGFLLARRYRMRFQLQVHTDICSPFQRTSSWKARFRWQIARFLIPRADSIRVVSHRIAQSLNSEFRIQNSKIVILPIFVDRVHIASAEPPFDLRKKYSQFSFIVLMVSRLSREKNILMAIGAFKEFLRIYPDAGLVIVGEGPERKNLELRIQNLELAHSVRLEGWQEDIVSYYKGAGLYLLTSDFEGYGRTVIEASAAGLPVIMTDVGIAGEIIRDRETGLVVPVRNRGKLTEALTWAAGHQEEMRVTARQTQREVLEMSPRTEGEYLEMYRQTFVL